MRPDAKKALTRGPGKPLKIEYMKRLVKNVCLSLSILTLMPLSAGAAKNGNASSEPYDWSPVMEAIIQVESGGDPNAVSGNSVGVMQITPILVKECNSILKQQGKKQRYTMADRKSVAKSKEMFLLIQSQHNKANNVEKAIRSWNGGPRYSVKATNRYYRKVLQCMK